ncbi:MAG TPA: hypothetical protein ENJ00_08330, partial [Phycisphaerales bacterium]|nr:hypothetical protein [Phycisphaerales bacterium]
MGHQVGWSGRQGSLLAKGVKIMNLEETGCEGWSVSWWNVIAALIFGICMPLSGPTAAQSCSPEQVSLLLSDGSWGYQFGSSVSVSGEVAAVGARGDRVNGINSGAVSMYRFDGSRWVLEAKLAADDGQAFDKFGESVSVSGSKVVIGAPGIDVNGYGSGGVYVFRFDGSNWIQEARLIPS